MNRRDMLKWTASAAGLALAGPVLAAGEPQLVMPAEWEPHARCFLALSPTYGEPVERELLAIHQAQARIAKAIARFEPVTMLVNREDMEYARQLLGPGIDLLEMEHHDIWTRDTLPTFVHGPDGLRAVDWNFNVWGEKAPDEDGYDVERTLARRLAAHLSIPLVRANIVCEGGGIETDGAGTLITTETCLLNPNRNPGLSRRHIENELMRLTGARRVIWLFGSEADTITDGHVDGIVRFVEPGVVVADMPSSPDDPDYDEIMENYRMLQAARDAQGRRLTIIPLARPRPEFMPPRGEHFAGTYINGYEANGGGVLPSFGDRERDIAARDLFARLRPDHEIVQIDVDAICEGGGGIHCNTQQLPVFPRT